MSSCRYCDMPEPGTEICDRHLMLLERVDNLLGFDPRIDALASALASAWRKGSAYEFDVSGDEPITIETGLPVGRILTRRVRTAIIGGRTDSLVHVSVCDMNGRIWKGKAKNPKRIRFRPGLYKAEDAK